MIIIFICQKFVYVWLYICPKNLNKSSKMTVSVSFWLYRDSMYLITLYDFVYILTFSQTRKRKLVGN